MSDCSTELVFLEKYLLLQCWQNVQQPIILPINFPPIRSTAFCVSIFVSELCFSEFHFSTLCRHCHMLLFHFVTCDILFW